MVTIYFMPTTPEYDYFKLWHDHTTGQFAMVQSDIFKQFHALIANLQNIGVPIQLECVRSDSPRIPQGVNSGRKPSQDPRDQSKQLLVD